MSHPHEWSTCHMISQVMWGGIKFSRKSLLFYIMLLYYYCLHCLETTFWFLYYSEMSFQRCAVAHLCVCACEPVVTSLGETHGGRCYSGFCWWSSRPLRLTRVQCQRADGHGAYRPKNMKDNNYDLKDLGKNTKWAGCVIPPPQKRKKMQARPARLMEN